MTSLRTVPELHTRAGAILVRCGGTHDARITRTMRITNVILSLTTVVSIATIAGCSKKSKATEVAAPTPTQPAASAKAKPAKVGAEGVSFLRVALPQERRETRVVKDLPVDAIAREIADWISKG